MVKRLQQALPAFLLPLLTLLFFYKLAFTNLILARGDIFLYFYPYWQMASEALRAGDMPLWNPDLFMGAPFIANSQIGFFYPPNWLAWWQFSPPNAAKVTIIAHLIVASAGAYAAARKALGHSQLAGLLAAILFGLGGYLTAQVEHLNQLQALAWLPWHLWALHVGDGRRRVLAIAALFAIQLLAGHTQSVFISGVGAGVWGLALMAADDRISWRKVQLNRERSLTKIGMPLIVLALGAIWAGGLAAIQLLPTIELAGQSSRAGGLTPAETMAFSLHPLILGRAFLPGYGQTIFTEYVAFLPLSGWVLAVAGILSLKEFPRRILPPLALLAVGFALALGGYNPLNWQIARLPGFDLFRVPARWLILTGLGAALLAGAGLDAWRERARQNAGILGGRWFWFALSVPLFLALWSVISVPLTRFLPLSPEVAAEYPSPLTVAGWGLELAFLYLILRNWGLRRHDWYPDDGKPARLAGALLILCIAALFGGSRSLPYHANPTTPEAFSDIRPAMARLQAFAHCAIPHQPCHSPPGRMLSLSDIFFDPGDMGEIETIYAGILSETAAFDYTVAIKQKEIVAPNLPLVAGIPSVDGFDGGVLPLKLYSDATQLILPDGVSTTDGRLREHLPGIPAARWLDLFNVEYLLADRVGDDWREGVFFDLHHPAALAAGEQISVGHIPDFAGTELWVWSDGTPGIVSVSFEDGSGLQLPAERFSDELAKAAWDTPAQPTAITLIANDEPWTARGLAVVDGRDNSFRELVAGNYRVLYSGDVKIYQNSDALPRAYLAHQWEWQPDTAAALNAMRQPDFDPRQEAVLTGGGEGGGSEPAAGAGSAVIVSYSPEEVVIQVDNRADGWLILSDAYYPGWRAEIDGERAEIVPANGMFRGTFVPAGSAQIRFFYAPLRFWLGVGLTIFSLLVWGVAWLWLKRLSKKE